MADSRKNWVLAVLGISLVGVVIAALLTWEKFAGVDLPLCSTDGVFDCAGVNASKYSAIRGIPIAALGFVAYVLMAGLAVTRIRKGPDQAAGSMAYAFLLALGSVAFSAFLFYVSKVVLEKFCLYCIALYVVNASLLVASWGALGGPGRLASAIRADLDGMGRQKPVAYALSGLIVVLGVVAAVKPGPFWTGEATTISIPIGNTDKWKEEARASILNAPYMNPGPGGGYGKGAENPILTIVEFADLECPACRRQSWELGELVHKYPDQVRVVFRHFPLDMKCNSTMRRVLHQHACDTSLAAEAAGLQGKFWEYHDAVYHPSDNLFKPNGQPDLSPEANRKRAQKLGLDVKEWEAALGREDLLQKLVDDITDAVGFGVTSTPTLFVNGRKIPGMADVRTFELWLEMAKKGELDPPSTAGKP